MAIEITATLVELDARGPGGLPGIGVELEDGTTMFLPMAIEQIRALASQLYNRIKIAIDIKTE